MRSVRIIAIVLASLAIGPMSGCAQPSRDVPAAAPLALPEGYAHSIAALGFPGARRAFQVGHGSTVSTGETTLEFQLSADSGAARPSPVAFESDGVPIAHWWTITPSDSIHFEAAAAPHPALGDTSLILSLRVSVHRRTTGGTFRMTARVRGTPKGPHHVPWDTPDVSHFGGSWLDRLAIRNGRMVAGLDPAARTTVEIAAPEPDMVSHTATCSTAIAPGGSARWEFWMPAYPIAPDHARRLAGRVRHDKVARQARTSWREWLGRAAPLHHPDDRIGAGWRAALVTIIQCHERNGSDWVPIGSPFQYRDVWLRDAARVVRALSVAGLTELARADAWTLRHFQLDNGVFLSQRGQLDGTGQALWAFEQAASIPPSRDEARRYLPFARRGAAWIETQRRATRGLALPYGGLLPYADPRDNENVRAQLVGSDAWGLAGERATAAMAARAGEGRLADTLLVGATEYARTFMEALSRHAGGIPPSWQGAGRDWGNLSVVYPTRVLEPLDPRVATLARRMWRAGPGLVGYGPVDSLHGYLGVDLAQTALLAGRAADAQAVLAAMIQHSSSTLGQAETFSRSTGGFGANLPPHATAAAMLVDLVRNMIVSDTRDTLEVGLGAPLAWWNDLSLERAPTRFGIVDLRLEHPAPDRLRATWSGPKGPVRVRVPEEVRAVGVASPGAASPDGRWITCPPGSRRAEFRIAAVP